MYQLLEKGQEMKIVPQELKDANKGTIVEVNDYNFNIKVAHSPENLTVGHKMEFYSETSNGTLYFVSGIEDVEGDIVTVGTPIRHRYLQRRVFTRVDYESDMELILNNKSYIVKSVDLSAGGVKFTTSDKLDIDKTYEIVINLLKDQSVKCEYKTIKIEKNSDDIYTLSGRFQNLSKSDKMKLVQFCMRRHIEHHCVIDY